MRGIFTGEASITSDEEGEKSPVERRSEVFHRAEISANHHADKHVGNGSIPSGTPHGSLHSLHSGTPTSTDSFDMPSSPKSDHGVPRCPEIIEHPPSPDSEAPPMAHFGMGERDPPDGAQDCQRHNSVRVCSDVVVDIPSVSPHGSSGTGHDGHPVRIPSTGGHHSGPLYTTVNKKRDDRKRLLKCK